MEKSNSTKVNRVGLLVGAFAPALLMLASGPTPATAESEITGPIAQITLPNKITSFDLGFVDSALGYYVLTDRTSGGTLDVINTTTNPPSLVSQIGLGQLAGVQTAISCAGGTATCNVSGPNGVLIVNHRTLWAGDGDSSVKVFSFGGTLLQRIPTGGVARADEMCFDSTHQLVMVTNAEAEGAAPGYPFTTIINAKTYQITHKITWNPTTLGTTNGAAGGGAEQCQYNPRTGTFFLAIPACGYNTANTADGCVVEIAPTTGAVVGVYRVLTANCGKPQGMAIGPAPQILLGCNTSVDGTDPTEIMNDGSTGGTKGGVFQVMAGAAGNDVVDFNPSTGHYYLAGSSWNNSPAKASPCGPGKLHIIDAGTSTPGSASSDDDITTSLGNCTNSAHGGSHSVTADPVHNYIFLPMASTSGATFCSTAPVSSGGSGVDTNGCIAIFKDNGP